MQSSPDKHQGVKSIQINRARIKERIQEKHRQQTQLVRQNRLSGLREAADDGCHDDGLYADEQQHQQQQQLPIQPPPASFSTSGIQPGLTTSPSTASAGLCFHPDGTLLMPTVQDWSDIGHEFGVNIYDTNVMDCLLALEEEIRQEQLFVFYDQTNGNEWEEYYNSLNS